MKTNLANEAKVSFENVKDLFFYEEIAGLLIWKKKGTGSRTAGSYAGSVSSSGYTYVHIFGLILKYSRVVWLWHKGAWPTNEMDHINGIKLDDRIENLREATRHENTRNRSVNMNAISKYKGVQLIKNKVKPSSRYRAGITANGKVTFLGVFRSEIEAAKMYDAAATFFHKDFAKLNFPERPRRDWLFV